MFSKKVRRTLPVLLAVALLALPGLAQAYSFDRAERASLFDLFQQQVAELASVLWGGIAGAWDKDGGAGLDPHGNPGNGTGTTGGSSTGTSTDPEEEEGEGGVSIDPNG